MSTDYRDRKRYRETHKVKLLRTPLELNDEPVTEYDVIDLVPYEDGMDRAYQER